MTFKGLPHGKRSKPLEEHEWFSSKSSLIDFWDRKIYMVVLRASLFYECERDISCIETLGL